MKNFKLKTTGIASILAVGVLSGCATQKETNKEYQQNRERVTSDLTGSQPVSSVAIADPSQDRMANFGRSTRNWVNPIPLPKNTLEASRARLPEFFKRQVSLTMPGKVTIVEILSELQRVSSFKVNMHQDIYDTSLREATVVGAGTGGASTAPMSPVFVSDFVYRGSLENALDLLASKANVAWKWNGSGIELYRFETKSYNVTLLAGSTSSTSEVKLQSDTDTEDSGGANTGGGQAGTSGANTVQGVKRTANLDSWNDVKGYLLSLMSPQGSIAIMESTGLVTVRDTPSVQAKVAAAIKELNEIIGKQIYISVDVYAVTKDAADDYGLNWNLAWSSLRNNVNYTSTSGSTAPNSLNIGVLTGPFAGTNVVAQALSRLGRTSVVNQFQITTLNGQPTPIGNNKKIPYISNIEVVTDANGNPTQSVTTGAIFQGISMNVIPKVQPNGKILLEYAMNLSDFEGFTNFSTGTGANSVSLNLPTTTLKNILQRASLRSGQALVLSGFKQTINSTTDRGIGSPKNYLFGGGVNAQQQEQYLVITVTPYLSQESD